jgi:starvation-inducible DNA-binding protein
LATHDAEGGRSEGSARSEVKIGRELELSAIELIDLGLLARQLQWSASGPFAALLNSTLESLRKSWDQMASQLAGRSVAAGRWPDAQAEAIVAGPDHTTVASGPIEDQAALSLVVDCLDGLVDRIRGRASSFEERDTASRVLLAKVAAELEEQWVTLRSQLPFGDVDRDKKGTT